MSIVIRYLILAVLLLAWGSTAAQIPVEWMVGNKKSSIDLMFFRFIKDRNKQPSRVLFFSRARATVDYKMTSTSNLPTFGLTEAISYNPRNWKGFAPVAVVQVFNRGLFPKAGMQYAHTGKQLTVFSWLVVETMKEPDIDYFLLMRFTPALSPKLKLFTQLEAVNSFPTRAGASFGFTQRMRLGLMQQQFQYGLAADLSQQGNRSFQASTNLGGFLRVEL